jgi:hypothetical protein
VLLKLGNNIENPKSFDKFIWVLKTYVVSLYFLPGGKTHATALSGNLSPGTNVAMLGE